jgi:uncharacterized protein YndB with AHSA1/START domain
MAPVITPVRRSIEVPLPPAQAFDLFTAGIAEWWPYATHFSRGPVKALVFETRLGGKLNEVCTDGVVETYGEVLAWEPPRRVVIKWMVAQHRVAPTEVEVRFTATPQGCRLDLEHRGFDSGTARDSYASGWPGVLELFARSAGMRRP